MTKATEAKTTSKNPEDKVVVVRKAPLSAKPKPEASGKSTTKAMASIKKPSASSHPTKPTTASGTKPTTASGTSTNSTKAPKVTRPISSKVKEENKTDAKPSSSTQHTNGTSRPKSSTVPKNAVKKQAPATQSKVVYMFRLGDKAHTGEKFVINTSRFKTFDQLKATLSKDIRLPGGQLGKIYGITGELVKELSQFTNGEFYICCTSNEKYSRPKLPTAVLAKLPPEDGNTSAPKTPNSHEDISARGDHKEGEATASEPTDVEGQTNEGADGELAIDTPKVSEGQTTEEAKGVDPDQVEIQETNASSNDGSKQTEHLEVFQAEKKEPSLDDHKEETSQAQASPDSKKSSHSVEVAQEVTGANKPNESLSEPSQVQLSEDVLIEEKEKHESSKQNVLEDTNKETEQTQEPTTSQATQTKTEGSDTLNEQQELQPIESPVQPPLEEENKFSEATPEPRDNNASSEAETQVMEESANQVSLSSDLEVTKETNDASPKEEVQNQENAQHTSPNESSPQEIKQEQTNEQLKEEDIPKISATETSNNDESTKDQPNERHSQEESKEQTPVNQELQEKPTEPEEQSKEQSHEESKEEPKGDSSVKEETQQQEPSTDSPAQQKAEHPDQALDEQNSLATNNDSPSPIESEQATSKVLADGASTSDQLPEKTNDIVTETHGDVQATPTEEINGDTRGQ